MFRSWPSFELMLACVWTHKFVTEAVSVAPLPSRLWFLSYRDTMNHLTTVYLLWNVCSDIIGSQTISKMIICVKPGLITCVFLFGCDVCWCFHSPLATKFTRYSLPDSLGCNSLAVKYSNTAHEWTGLCFKTLMLPFAAPPGCVHCPQHAWIALYFLSFFPLRSKRGCRNAPCSQLTLLTPQ